MDYMKELIDGIIKDLGDDKPINRILLKAQIIAHKLGNQQFKEWIRNEQNGYPNSENLPEYRIIKASLKADINQPYVKIVQNFPIAVGCLDKKYEDYAYNVKIIESLSEIENLCCSANDILSTDCPAFLYQVANKSVNGHVERLWQEFSKFSCLQIINVFKSRLLDFFLELGEDIDFKNIEGQRKISSIVNNYHINSVVTNTGNGTINTRDISDNKVLITDVEEQNKIRVAIEELRNVITQSNNKELNASVEKVIDECKKPSWSKKVLSETLNAMKDIAVSVMADQLIPIISKCVELLK